MGHEPFIHGSILSLKDSPKKNRRYLDIWYYIIYIQGVHRDGYKVNAYLREKNFRN